LLKKHKKKEEEEERVYLPSYQHFLFLSGFKDGSNGHVRWVSPPHLSFLFIYYIYKFIECVINEVRYIDIRIFLAAFLICIFHGRAFMSYKGKCTYKGSHPHLLDVYLPGFQLWPLT
jgi:hypothetical protein